MSAALGARPTPGSLLPPWEPPLRPGVGAGAGVAPPGTWVAHNPGAGIAHNRGAGVVHILGEVVAHYLVAGVAQGAAVALFRNLDFAFSFCQTPFLGFGRRRGLFPLVMISVTCVLKDSRKKQGLAVHR